MIGLGICLIVLGCGAILAAMALLRQADKQLAKAARHRLASGLHLADCEQMLEENRRLLLHWGEVRS